MRRFTKVIKRRLWFKLLRKLPGFPLIPLVPAALVISSLVASLRALGRVRRLERRLASSPT
jgi:hypothetical protein